VRSFRFCLQLAQCVSHVLCGSGPARVIVLMCVGSIATPRRLELRDVPVHLTRYRFCAAIERCHTIYETQQLIEINGESVHQSGPTSTDEMFCPESWSCWP
jgi:hypothetical protein